MLADFGTDSNSLLPDLFIYSFFMKREFFDLIDPICSHSVTAVVCPSRSGQTLSAGPQFLLQSQ